MNAHPSHPLASFPAARPAVRRAWLPKVSLRNQTYRASLSCPVLSSCPPGLSFVTMTGFAHRTAADESDDSNSRYFCSSGRATDGLGRRPGPLLSLEGSCHSDRSIGYPPSTEWSVQTIPYLHHPVPRREGCPAHPLPPMLFKAASVDPAPALRLCQAVGNGKVEGPQERVVAGTPAR